jgi:hypothetical protein
MGGGGQPRGKGQPLFGLPPTSQQVSIPCTILTVLQTLYLHFARANGTIGGASPRSIFARGPRGPGRQPTGPDIGPGRRGKL